MGQEPNMEDTKKTFSEDYVRELREEAAKHRTEKQKFKTEVEELTTKLNDLTDKLNSIDVDEYKSLREEKAELLKKQKEAEKEQMKKQGEYEKLLEQTRAEMLEEFEKTKVDWQKTLEAESTKAKALSEQMAELDAQYVNTILKHNVVSAAAKEECINPDLIELVLSREVSIEKDDKGVPVFQFKDDSGEVRKNKDGKPLTIAERILEMKDTKEFAPLFAGGTNGSGATPKQKPSSVDNPWSKEGWNMTKQGMLIKTDYNAAKTLAAAAGHKI